MENFLDRELSYLHKNNGKEYYIYCLVDNRNDEEEIFYIGKGKGNRVFDHEEAAFDNKLEMELESEYKTEDLKISRIRTIREEGFEIKKIILNYWLTEQEAFVAESTLINFLNSFPQQKFINQVKGHGVRGIEVGKLSNQLESTPMSIVEMNTDELILAVKIRAPFALDADETDNYTFYNRDDCNLKSRTLGTWRVAKDKAEKIKYVLGINTGTDNTVVSAYKVSGFESGIDDKGGQRYCFSSNSSSEQVMKELGVYQKSLVDLRFGSGQAIAYINKD